MSVLFPCNFTHCQLWQPKTRWRKALLLTSTTLLILYSMLLSSTSSDFVRCGNIVSSFPVSRFGTVNKWCSDFSALSRLLHVYKSISLLRIESSVIKIMCYTPNVKENYTLAKKGNTFIFLLCIWFHFIMFKKNRVGLVWLQNSGMIRA